MMFQSNETFGAYCVFSSHDNVGFVGEDFFLLFCFFFGRVGNGLWANSTSI